LNELLGTVDSATTRRLELFFQEYDRNTVVQARHLIVRNGARVTVRNGSTVVFEKLNFSIPETDRLRVAIETTPA
jgi:hypothetical protein